MSPARIPRWLRFLFKLILCLVLGGLILSFLLGFFLSWHGKRTWEAERASYLRRGESLDFKQIAPPPIPDAANFCAIPALKDLPLIPQDVDSNTPQGRQRARLIDLPTTREVKYTASGDFLPYPSLSQGPTSGRPIDLAAWSLWLRTPGFAENHDEMNAASRDINDQIQHGHLPDFTPLTQAMQAEFDRDQQKKKNPPPPRPPASPDPAHDILASLAPSDSLLAELAAGLSRPGAQWTPAWSTRGIPDYPGFTFPEQEPSGSLAIFLTIQSVASAWAGDAAAAHRSALIVTRLVGADMQQPCLIGQICANGHAAFLPVLVWELCNAHCGSADDFRTLQAALVLLDFRTSLLCACREEAAYQVDQWDHIIAGDRRRFPFFATSGTKGILYNFEQHLMPRGILGENTAHTVEWYYDGFIQPLRDFGFHELLGSQQVLKVVLDSRRSHPVYEYGDSMAIDAISSATPIAYRTAYAQALIDQSIAACALERYRIEHGNTYPDTLAAANHPGEPPIPLDIISGQPIHYRKNSNGTYTLWSVGFDGKDDNAQRNLNPPDETHSEIHPNNPAYQGDWVWSFPGN